MARGPSFTDLETAFEHGNFKPLYMLYGEEQFLIEELQESLIRNALGPGERDFNLDIVYGFEADVQQVLGLCASYPVMAQRRVVIVRHFDALKQNRRFKDYAQSPNPSAVVMLVCASKPNLSAHPYRAIRENGVVAEMAALYDREVPGWIQRRAKKQGYQIEPAAVQMLADFVGSDLSRAASEIEKVATFAGDRSTLTRDDVIAASGQTREFNVFELQKAIGEGRYRDALRIGDRMLQQASNPSGEALMIVAILTSFLTKLWKLAALRGKSLSKKDKARRIGVPPFFLDEYVASLKRFPPAAIERGFSALMAADYELKGGANRDPRLVLTLLIRRLVAEG